MRRQRAFTLIELLVTIAIIAILLGILLPALGKARHTALAANCLSNLRNMQVAHWMYVADWNGAFVQVGLSHGAGDANEPAAWINTLQTYYGDALLHRSPLDSSPHWPTSEGGAGQPVHPGPPPVFRRTSYGCNNFLDAALVPWGGPYHLDNVPRPAATVHFLIMAFTGDFAGADHPHVENWVSNIPLQASRQVQTNAVGGPAASWASVANWGFLDGHAATLTFQNVFTDFNTNKFDPQVAR